MKFHTGVPSARRWMTPQNELAFLAAARELELWARGASQGASRVMETLEELEGLGNYSYHVLRSWGACCTAMHNRKVPGWKPRAVDDDGEIAAAQQMSPHVDLLHRAVVTAGWNKVTYPEFEACGPYSTNVVPDRELSIA